MKKIFLFLALLITIVSSAQIKITEMTTYPNYCPTCWVPVVNGTTNYKIAGFRLVDTTSQATRAWRQKLADSLNALINLKFNISDTANKWVQNVYQRSDSLFKLKNGTETFIGGLIGPSFADKNLAEVQLTANGEYQHNWDSHQLFIDSIGSFTFRSPKQNSGSRYSYIGGKALNLGVDIYSQYDANNYVGLTTTNANGTSFLYGEAAGAGKYSALDIHPNAITLKPHLGNFIIDSLADGVGTKSLRYDPATGSVTIADTTAASSIPTLQQTITASGILTTNNTVESNDKNLNFYHSNSGVFTAKSVNVAHSYQATLQISDANALLQLYSPATWDDVTNEISANRLSASLKSYQTDDANVQSLLFLHPDQIFINPWHGNLIIDTLVSSVGTKSLRYNPSTGVVSYSDTTGIHGIDDVLSVGQAVTTNRTIALSSHYLDITANTGSLYEFGPNFAGFLAQKDATHYSYFEGNGDNASNSNNRFFIGVKYGTAFSQTIFNSDQTSFDKPIKIADGTQSSGYVLTSDANGLASWQPATGGGGGGGISAVFAGYGLLNVNDSTLKVDTTFGNISTRDNVQKVKDSLIGLVGLVSLQTATNVGKITTNDITLYTADPSSDSRANAPPLYFKGKGNASDVITTAEWKFLDSVTTNSGASSFFLQQRDYSGSPGSWSNMIGISKDHNIFTHGSTTDGVGSYAFSNTAVIHGTNNFQGGGQNTVIDSSLVGVFSGATDSRAFKSTSDHSNYSAGFGDANKWWGYGSLTAGVGDYTYAKYGFNIGNSNAVGYNALDESGTANLYESSGGLGKQLRIVGDYAWGIGRALSTSGTSEFVFGSGIDATNTRLQNNTPGSIVFANNSDTATLQILKAAGAGTFGQININGALLLGTTPDFADTTNYKPLVINTTDHKVYKATYWPGSGGGGGSVTDFIFTDGNGFDGTVSTSTSTPTLSLTTTISDDQIFVSNNGALSGSSDLTYNGTTLYANAVLKLRENDYTFGGAGSGSDFPNAAYKVARIITDSTNEHFIIGLRGGWIVIGNDSLQSTNIGAGAYASQARNIAIGVIDTASGNFDAIGIGTAVKSRANDGIVTGPYAYNVTSSNSSAIYGPYSHFTAAGASGNLFGYNNTGSKDYVNGMGSNMILSGEGASGMGEYLTMSGDYTNALSQFGTIAANYAAALGYSITIASGHTNSIAIGKSISTTQANEMILGGSSIAHTLIRGAETGAPDYFYGITSTGYLTKRTLVQTASDIGAITSVPNWDLVLTQGGNFTANRTQALNGKNLTISDGNNYFKITASSQTESYLEETTTATKWSNLFHKVTTTYADVEMNANYNGNYASIFFKADATNREVHVKGNLYKFEGIPSGTTANVLYYDNSTGATTYGTISSGFTNPMTTLGDIIYENSTPGAARLAGNTTTTKQFLSQTGTGSVSAAPAWATLASTDIPITATQIGYGNGSNALTSSALFTWDNSNIILSIGDGSGGEPKLILNGDAGGSTELIHIKRNSLNNWIFGANGTHDFILNRYNSSGTFQGTDIESEFTTGNILLNSLKTGSSAPTTSGTTKMVITDADGRLSFQTIAGGGNVSNSGTPVDNQIAIWTGATTVEGNANFTYDGTTFTNASNTSLTGGFATTSYQTITSGSSATVSNATTTVRFDPASDLGTYTLTMPASPADGDWVYISFGGTIAASAAVVSSLTVSPNSGQSIYGAITLTQGYGGDEAAYQYKSSNTTWYRKK